MRRGEVVVLGVFAALVVGGAIVLGPGLLGRSERPRTPASPPAGRGGHGGPSPVRPAPRPGAAVSGERLEVRGERGAPAPAPATWRIVGGDLVGSTLVRRRARSVLLGATGHAWREVPAAGPDGTVEMSLAPAAAPIEVRVVEADGRPAPGVPVEYGPTAARLPRRTGADGRFVVDDAAPGVLRVHVGGTERDGPTLVLRAGRDTVARAVLEPGFRLAGAVVDVTGAPVGGARVGVLAPEGPAAPDAWTARDGTFTVTARASESLVVEVSADGFETGRVDAPPPDPTTVPAAASVRVMLTRGAGRLRATIDRRGLAAADRVDVEVEPAVASLAREAFGADVVVGEPMRFASPPGEDFGVDGWPSGVGVRVRLRGDVLPEDHVLRPDEARARDLRLAPERAPPAPPAPPQAPLPPDRLGAVRGVVRDAAGRGLAGLTVVVEGRRGATGADGAFAVDGLPRGERVEAVFGWLDGADAGDADPAAFAPWAAETATVGGDPLLAVLPAATALSARLLDGVTDRPLAFARVVLLDDRAEVALDRCVATIDGVVRFEGLPPVRAGTFVLLAPGLRKEMPVAPRAGQGLDLGDVRLGRGGRVTGVVKDRAGRRVAGAAVAVLEDGRIERAGLEQVRRRDVALRRATTGGDGAFVLDGLDAAAPVALAIAARGLSPTVRRVLFPDGPEASISVTLAKGGRMRVGLSDPAGAPISGASIELVDARSGARFLDVVLRATLGGVLGSTEDLRRAEEALLLEDPARRGTYRIGPLEPGPYDVLFSCPGFRPRRQKLTVPDAEPEDPTSPVRPLPLGSLEWQVTLEPEAPPSDGR